WEHRQIFLPSFYLGVVFSGPLAHLSCFHSATSRTSVFLTLVSKLFSPITNNVMRGKGFCSQPGQSMKSTSRHCQDFIKKLGFNLWLPIDFPNGSWPITKPHGPSGLPLAGRVRFGAFAQSTLALRRDRSETGCLSRIVGAKNS